MPSKPPIEEIDGTDDVTLEEIQSAGLELRRAISARENAQLVYKAAQDTEKSARARLELMTGARQEQRPLLDGPEGDDD